MNSMTTCPTCGGPLARAAPGKLGRDCHFPAVRACRPSPSGVVINEDRRGDRAVAGSAWAAQGIITRCDRERNLARDAQAWLAARARGLVPSARLNEAWERFYRLGAAVIRRGVRAQGLSGADGDDCEQEIWSEVVDQFRRSRYDPERAGLRTWLSTLAHNKAVDVIRRRSRNHQQSLDDETLATLHGREDDPATVYEQQRDQVRVRRALAELSRQVSECSHKVLLLRSIEGRAVSEVAAALGLTTEQVRHRHCRAKRELRRLIEAKEEGDAGDTGPGADGLGRNSAQFAQRVITHDEYSNSRHDVPE